MSKGLFEEWGDFKAPWRKHGALSFSGGTEEIQAPDSCNTKL